jgi:hypothetical protein
MVLEESTAHEAQMYNNQKTRSCLRCLLELSQCSWLKVVWVIGRGTVQGREGDTRANKEGRELRLFRSF